ncbi:hypothetical protein [Maricaulis sp.]|uniref:hypothetical protein n=1 Tax=Maricaulis sp. TaxID=1486257 RepID=UPI00260FFE22|nr:hypothetical protein [Maricaulis sp.]
MSFQSKPQGPAFVERLQVGLSALTSIVGAFIVTPFVVAFIVPYAVAFADQHYGLGFLMPLLVWLLSFALVALGIALFLKIVFTRETLRFVLPTR